MSEASPDAVDVVEASVEAVSSAAVEAAVEVSSAAAVLAVVEAVSEELLPQAASVNAVAAASTIAVIFFFIDHFLLKISMDR